MCSLPRASGWVCQVRAITTPGASAQICKAELTHRKWSEIQVRGDAKQTAHGPAASFEEHCKGDTAPCVSQGLSTVCCCQQGLPPYKGRPFMYHLIACNLQLKKKESDTFNLFLKTLTYFLLLRLLSPHHLSLVPGKWLDFFLMFLGGGYLLFCFRVLLWRLVLVCLFFFFKENILEAAQGSRNHQVSLVLSSLVPEMPLKICPMVDRNPDTQQISLKAEKWALSKAVLPAEGYLGLSACITSWERNASQLHWLSHFKPPLMSVAVIWLCCSGYFAQSCREHNSKRIQPASSFILFCFKPR